MGKPGLVNRPRTLAAAVALSVCSSAFAADMPINLPPPTPTRALPDEHPGFGWYIRGDLGYRFQHFAGASSSDAAQVPALSSSTLANDFVGGYGVGSQMQWLRVDLTGDYGGRSRFTGTTATGAPATALVETFTLMLNAYLDLGTWGGFTPYIGAGGGGAYAILSNYQYAAAVAPMPATAGSQERWNPAWAVMAGVSYSVTRQFLVDVGYRHLDLGDMTGGPVGALAIKRVTGDEIRVGFRYLID